MQGERPDLSPTQKVLADVILAKSGCDRRQTFSGTTGRDKYMGVLDIDPRSVNPQPKNVLNIYFYFKLLQNFLYLQRFLSVKLYLNNLDFGSICKWVELLSYK